MATSKEKFDKNIKKRKILLLCHGNKHTFNCCPFPVSKKMMPYIVTLDNDPTCESDIREDFTRPTKIKKESFDLTCAIFYPQSLIVSNDGTLEQNHFISNITKILKIGGYYILTKLPRDGLINFCKYLRSEEGQCLLICLRKARTMKNILKLNIDDLTFDHKIIINRVFGLYVQHCYPNLKLLQTKKELHDYKNDFLTNFVYPNDSIDKIEQKYGFDVEKAMQIFVKI